MQHSTASPTAFLSDKIDLAVDLAYKLVEKGQRVNGEIGSAIVAGCMLSIRQFFHHMMPKLSIC